MGKTRISVLLKYGVPKTTYLVWSCRENGPNATTKNYDPLETWRKEKTRPSPENLERWNIYSHEWKRSKNGRMEQSKAMEYEIRKASSGVLKPRNIYRMSQEGCARLREGVPYVKVYRYNPKHLCPKLNGYGDNGQRSLKLWQLLHTCWLSNTY